MAFIAGAGNPAGSGGTSGTGRGLNFVGDHCFAYSGNFVSSGTDDTTYLEFGSPSNQYIVGRFEFMYDETANASIDFEVNFNDESIASFIIGNAGSAGTGLQPAVVHVIIPGDTRVKVTCKGNSSNFTVAFTGRVYR